MKKELKDYLHLYLGCSVKWYNGKIATLIDTDKTNCNIYDVVKYHTGIENIKPILRPLSDMTEEEEMEWRNISGGNQSPTLKESAEEIRWFLSKHFDLFGLIEAGLAIDKTKL